MQKWNVTDMDLSHPQHHYIVGQWGGRYFFLSLFCLSFTGLLLGSFHPVASAAIGQFKWLLTGSAGDLWLHLSLTWNPLPSGFSLYFSNSLPSSYTHSILHPFIVLSGLPLSVLPLLRDIMSFSSVYLFVYLDFLFIFCRSIPLMHFSLFFFICRTSWGPGVKEVNKRREQWRVYCVGLLIIDRLTNQSGGKWGMSQHQDTHPQNQHGELNRTRLEAPNTAPW